MNTTIDFAVGHQHAVEAIEMALLQHYGTLAARPGFQTYALAASQEFADVMRALIEAQAAA